MRSYLPRREMTDQQNAHYRQLQHIAFNYDNYELPLLPWYPLSNICTDSTKLSQLQCIPIFGNFVVLILCLKYIYSCNHFGSVTSHHTFHMLAVVLSTFFISLIPVVSVIVTLKTKPMYKCWQIMYDAVREDGLDPGISFIGRRAQFPCTQTVPDSHLSMGSNAVAPILSPITVTSLNLGPSSPLWPTGKVEKPQKARCMGDSTTDRASDRTVADPPEVGRRGTARHPDGFMDIATPRESWNITAFFRSAKN